MLFVSEEKKVVGSWAANVYMEAAVAIFSSEASGRRIRGKGLSHSGTVQHCPFLAP
jgi:hypothetical protein